MAGKRMVLVHGAFHGAWCWEEVAPRLEALGHKVELVDLPGLGADPTPSELGTLEAYGDAVVGQLRSGPEPAVLVGHSMGGAAITLAADRAPDLVSRLIFLAAVAPLAGDSVRATMNAARVSVGLPGVSTAAPDGGPSAQNFVGDARAAFFHLCPPDRAERAVMRLRPQAQAPLLTPLAISEARLAAIPKSYVLCEEDRAVPAQVQAAMAAGRPEFHMRRMATDHSPFYSDPDGLVAILDEEARRP